MFDKMLAQMLGIEPEEMGELIGGMQTMLKDGVGLLNELKVIGEANGKKLDGLLNLYNEEITEEKTIVGSNGNNSIAA
jgi:hypothetical protein